MVVPLNKFLRQQQWAVVSGGHSRGGNDISLCFIFLDFSYLAFILFQHVVHSHCSCNVWIFFRLPFGANVGDDQLYTELSKQTVVIENRGRVSHPEVAWTVLRLDLGERMLQMWWRRKWGRSRGLRMFLEGRRKRPWVMEETEWKQVYYNDSAVWIVWISFALHCV